MSKAYVCIYKIKVFHFWFILLQRFSRFEEEEKNRIETRKRKFFADLLNAARELQLQVQAAQKRRKQRNDGVQA